MRRAILLVMVTLALAIFAGCAPTGTSDGTGDGLHSIVPDVTGMTLAVATTTLADAGYVVGEVTGDTSDASALVVEQSPVASTSLPRDGAVDLTVTSDE